MNMQIVAMFLVCVGVSFIGIGIMGGQDPKSPTYKPKLHMLTGTIFVAGIVITAFGLVGMAPRPH